MTNQKIEFDRAPKKPTNIEPLGTLKLDFSELLGDGRVVSLDRLANRPRLARDFSLALWAYVKSDHDVSTQHSVNTYLTSIQKFWNYLDTIAAPLDDGIKAAHLNNETFIGFRAWLDSEANGSRITNNKDYHRIRRLMMCLKEHYPDKIRPELNPSDRSQKHLRAAKSEVEIYTETEFQSIEKACRNDINAVLHHLNEGERLSDAGQDPRGRYDKRDPKTGRILKHESRWSVLENVLWYVKHVLNSEFKTRPELQANGHSQLVNVLCGVSSTYVYRSADIYGYLLPTTRDLLPFLLMLAVKTGLNLESLITLKRDCKQPAKTVEGACIITYTKNRGAKTTYQRSFDDSKRFSPGQIVNEVLRITEPLVNQAPPDQRDRLWLALTVHNKGTPIKALEPAYTLFLLNNSSEDTSSWSAKHCLTTENGAVLTISSRQIRKTYLTNLYKKKGNLARISKDAKHEKSSTTSKHYIDSKYTQHEHEKTISDVQNDLVNMFRGCVLGEQASNAEDADVASSELNLSTTQSIAILKGEQDVFVASCKDFYNKPGGTPGKPCDMPWGCFTCQNAVFTSHILPRIVAFMRFIEQQKEVLPLEDWKSKFWTPYAIIKYKILPAFKRETIEWAERTAQDQTLFIPNEMRTA